MIALVLSVAALLLLAAAADVWFMPWLLERQIKSGLSRHWEGGVSMDAVRFSFFGPTEIDGLRLEDSRGRAWIEVGRSRANLRDWPGLSPAVNELELDGATVRIYVGEPFPVVQPEEERDPSPYIDLEHLRVHSVAVILHHDGESVEVGRMRVAVEIDGEAYRFDVSPLSDSAGGMQASGVIAGAPAEIEARVRLDRQVGREEMAFLQTFLGGELPVRQAEGFLQAEAAAAGRLEHWTELDFGGRVRLESWDFVTVDDLPVRDLEATVELRDWQLMSDDIRLTVLDSRVTGDFSADLAADAISYRGAIRSEGIDLGRAGRAFDVAALQSGRAAFELLIRGATGSASPAGPASPGDSKSPAAGTGYDSGRVEFEGTADIKAGLDAGPLTEAVGPLRFAGWWPVGGRREGGNDRGEGESSRSGGRAYVELRDWHLLDRAGPFARGVTARVELDERLLTVPQMSAEILGGYLTATGRMALPDGDGGEGRPLEFGGRVKLRDVQVEALAELFGGKESEEISGSADFDAGWSITSGEALRINAIGGGRARIATAHDEHEVSGHFSLDSDVTAESPALELRLRDWDWHRNNEFLAALTDSVIEVRENRVSSEEIVILTSGGELLARGVAWRRDTGQPWQYEGQFRADEFDPLPFFYGGGGGGGDGGAGGSIDGNGGALLPDALLTLRGRFRGIGDSLFQASADGVAAGMWLEPYTSRVMSDVSVDFALREMNEPDLLDRMELTVRLADGQIDHRQETVMRGIAGEAEIHRGGVKGLLSGEGVGGEIIAQFGTGERDEAMFYWSDITLSRLDLARLPAVAGAAPDWLLGTRLDSRIWVETQADDVVALKGSGSVTGRLAVEQLTGVAGDYEFDLTVQNFRGEDGPGVRGTARLTDGELRNPRGVLVENLRMSAIGFGRSADVSSIRGNLLGGRARGMFRIDFPADESMNFRGGLSINRLDLNRAAHAFGHTGEKVHGNGDLHYRFAGDGFALEAVRGNGALVIRDSEMVGVPMLQAILAALVLAPQSAEDTDLDLRFSNQGPVVTLLSGRAATPVVAIRPIPGGTINLATRELDFVVVAAMLRELEQLTDIPVLDLLVPMLARLTQVEVTGTWEDTEKIRTRVNPASGITGATAEFFRGVGRTGGDLGETFVQPLRQTGP